MLRILTVDDHEVVRGGVKNIFTANRSESIVGEASTADEAVKMVREQDWDVIILDITLGGRSGLEVIKDLKQIKPGLPILILSMHGEEEYARRAFKAGASGYVTKDSPSSDLLEAVDRLTQGSKYASPVVMEKLLSSLGRSADAPHEALSDREFEVMCLIASGRTVGEIAQLLSLSDKTVSTYRARILEKMRMKTNAALTHYAIQSKLVE